MVDILINTSKCMARKNLKDGINCQCKNNKKLGDYCGIHYKSKKRIRIDEEINIECKIHNINGVDYFWNNKTNDLYDMDEKYVGKVMSNGKIQTIE